MVDIFVIKQLHYYFFSLTLLLIPLVFRFFVFLMTDLSTKLLPEFQEFLIFNKPEPLNSNLAKCLGISLEHPATVSITLKPEYGDMDLHAFLFDCYYPVAFLRSHVDVTFLPLYTQISSYTSFFYYLIHSICWSYILFIF